MDNLKETETIEKKPMITEAEEKALQVEAELEKMIAIKSEWTFDEIGEEFPIVHDIIFDNYDEEEENGITTDRFSLLEKEKKSEVFIIKAN